MIHDYTRKNGVAERSDSDASKQPQHGVRTAPNSGMLLKKPSGGRTHNLRGKFELAIPRELAQDAARETVLNFVRENFVSQRHDRRRGLSQSGRVKPTRAHHADP